MSLASPVPVTERKDEIWMNWHETIRHRVHKFVDIYNRNPHRSTINDYNATTARLRGYIAEALRDRKQLRALGGGWSWSPVADTNGILINTLNLNYWFTLTGNVIHQNYSGDRSGLFFVQAGMSIGYLNRVLEARGRALKTSGASNGQSLAGALSTGTHGAAFDVGAIQDYVVALHVITGPGDHVWIERQSHPVAADSLLQQLGVTRILRDNDDDFNAAVVGLGSFGFVHGMVIETEPSYFLQVFRKRYEPSDGLWKVLSQVDFSAFPMPVPGQRPHHLEAIFNPSQMSSGPFVKLMFKFPNRPANARPLQESAVSAGEDAGGILGALLDAVDGLTPLIQEPMLRLLFRDIDGECGTRGEVFGDTRTRGPLRSSALGIHPNQLETALDYLASLTRTMEFPGFYSLRFVKASRATLAFTRHEPVTCVLELDALDSRDADTFRTNAWVGLHRLGLKPTFHWGKVLPLDPELVLGGYGQERVEAWIRARTRVLTDPAVRGVFNNVMLHALELDREPIGPP